MRRSVLLAPLALCLSAGLLWADARISVLVDVIALPEAAAILSEEGIGQAQGINDDMLGGQGGAGWLAQVQRIYDPQRMVESVRAELEDALEGEALEAVITFYASDLGTQIIGLENAARVAIQDPDVEAAARARYQSVVGSDDARLALLDRYVAGGDMVSRNVTSAINSNFQFLRGLADGDAIEMSEADMLSDAAGDLDEVTQDTTEWLFGYLLLAYHPLDANDLETYVTFSESPAGQALNRALFAGFGRAYEDVSYGLGRAVALNMLAEEL